MKLRVLVIPAFVALAACAGGAWWALRPEAAPRFKTAEVSVSDVRKVVTATGSLRAETMVDVGTQVSGLIAELLVDFNQEVRKDQVLARLDTSLLEADVAAGRARRDEAAATARRKALEHERVAKLHASQAATDQELEVARADAEVAEAQRKSAEVSLARSLRNLDYATIRSPVDGTVVARAVEVGQTVNAGFSAPTLFTLAGDLSHMQILARVDESDIGLVQEGGAVDFTVQTFPDRPFPGKVRQVRLESVTDQSVVTYTVVVDVDNPDRSLLPGMTATVSFIVAEKKGVICAPNAALRYRPSEKIEVAGMPEEEGKGKKGRGPSLLYAVEGEGLRALPVKGGIRGTECTEVEGVEAGQQVVIGEEAGGAGGSSPWSSGGAGSRRPGGF